MKTNQLGILASRLALAALMLHGVTVGAAPVEFAGRGVFHFTSASGCPPGGLDTTHTECNRIAIDRPDTRVGVNAENHTIVFSTGATQEKEAVVGDVLIHGSGVSEEGQRVPLSLHVLLRRAGKKWDVDSYIHAPVRGNFSSVSIDPYQIVAREGAQTRVLLTPERAHKMFADPSLRKRLARAFVSVRSTSAVNAANDNITVALGLGKFSTSVLRAGFTSSNPASAGDLARTFNNGNWAIELEALSDRIPRWVVQRELFLFGLDAHPALQTLREVGFKDHDKLTFGARDGKGYLRLNDQEAPFDGAAASGHAFMQESFMGMILAWQRTLAGQATAASSAAPKPPRS
ncbi:hypothetical protein [Massilia sp. S19_KUP03_FR1]|uniref:hypothetical protein n=1 Tax=Massilia sp. S19_KUP03_FR1 TaxID=3025503 RepID=UPI002FCD87D4